MATITLTFTDTGRPEDGDVEATIETSEQVNQNTPLTGAMIMGVSAFKTALDMSETEPFTKSDSKLMSATSMMGRL